MHTFYLYLYLIRFQQHRSFFQSQIFTPPFGLSLRTLDCSTVFFCFQFLFALFQFSSLRVQTKQASYLFSIQTISKCLIDSLNITVPFFFLLCFVLFQACWLRGCRSFFGVGFVKYLRIKLKFCIGLKISCCGKVTRLEHLSVLSLSFHYSVSGIICDSVSHFLIPCSQSFSVDPAVSPLRQTADNHVYQVFYNVLFGLRYRRSKSSVLTRPTQRESKSSGFTILVISVD